MTFDENEFPEAIYGTLGEFIKNTIPEVKHFVGRELRPTDSNDTVAAYSLRWEPDASCIGHRYPELSHYDIAVNFFQKMSGDEAKARADHSRITKSIRALLYGDDDLRIALAQLRDITPGASESVVDWSVVEQVFLSSEIHGNFVFLSSTILRVRTRCS